MTRENTVNVPDEQDVLDTISDAIGDSMDLDWTYNIGAKAIVEAFKREGWTLSDAPLHEGEGDELRESVARIIDPAAFMFGPGELDDKVYSASRAHAIDRADRILKLIASARSAPPPSVEVERLREALERFLWWGQQQCPCDNDEPNPCPLCGASIENLERCKAVEEKFPRDILTQARAALSRKEQEPGQ